MYKRLNCKRKIAKIARQRTKEKTKAIATQQRTIKKAYQTQFVADSKIIRFRETIYLCEIETIRIAYKKKVAQQEKLREFNKINCI